MWRMPEQRHIGDGRRRGGSCAGETTANGWRVWLGSDLAAALSSPRPAAHARWDDGCYVCGSSSRREVLPYYVRCTNHAEGRARLSGCPRPHKIPTPAGDRHGKEYQLGSQLSEEQRKRILEGLWKPRTETCLPPPSLRLVAERFSLRESRVRQIERAGLDNHWPPL